MPKEQIKSFEDTFVVAQSETVCDSLRPVFADVLKEFEVADFSSQAAQDTSISRGNQ